MRFYQRRVQVVVGRAFGPGRDLPGGEYVSNLVAPLVTDITSWDGAEPGEFVLLERGCGETYKFRVGIQAHCPPEMRLALPLAAADGDAVVERGCPNQNHTKAGLQGKSGVSTDPAGSSHRRSGALGDRDFVKRQRGFDFPDRWESGASGGCQ